MAIIASFWLTLKKQGSDKAEKYGGGGSARGGGESSGKNSGKTMLVHSFFYASIYIKSEPRKGNGCAPAAEFHEGLIYSQSSEKNSKAYEKHESSCGGYGGLVYYKLAYYAKNTANQKRLEY